MKKKLTRIINAFWSIKYYSSIWQYYRCRLSQVDSHFEPFKNQDIHFFLFPWFITVTKRGIKSSSLCWISRMFHIKTLQPSHIPGSFGLQLKWHIIGELSLVPWNGELYSHWILCFSFRVLFSRVMIKQLILLLFFKLPSILLLQEEVTQITQLASSFPSDLH